MKEILVNLFHELNSIQYGQFELASGEKSHYKIDAKKPLLHPQGLNLICDLTIPMLNQIEEKDECKYEFAGIYSGGFIYVAGMVYKTMRPGIGINHKTQEIYGVKKDGPYVVFEDVTTTGGSIIKSVKFAGINTKYAIAVVNRGGNEVKENLEKEGIQFKSLLTKADLGIT